MLEKEGNSSGSNMRNPKLYIISLGKIPTLHQIRNLREQEIGANTEVGFGSGCLLDFQTLSVMTAEATSGVRKSPRRLMSLMQTLKREQFSGER